MISIAGSLDGQAAHLVGGNIRGRTDVDKAHLDNIRNFPIMNNTSASVVCRLAMERT